MPTDAGRCLVDHAERVELETEAAERAIGGADQQAAGAVRVTSVPLIVHHLIVPTLPALLSAHPGLQVELIAEPADLSLMHRQVDIALRLARPRDEARALTRRICDVDYGVFGAAAGSQGAGWIAYAEGMGFLPQNRWLAEQIADDGARPVRLRVNDAETLLSAVKAGMGRAFLPLFLAGREPGLRRLDDGSRRWSRELWMLSHPDLREVARVRVTADWLVAELRGRLTTNQREPAERRCSAP